jgi:very-short-patch-repair endonuclease
MQSRRPDLEISRLAGRQYGVVAREQLVGLGLSKGAIDRRVQAGRLHVLDRGVYAVGHRIVPPEGRWLAAILRVGEGAALSHSSAAVLWGLRRSANRERIDVATPRSSRSTPSIQRRHVQLWPDEVTVRRRIPVTTLARTLFDISAETSAEGLEGAIRQAEYLHRFRLEALERMLDRHPGRRGVATVRACLRHLGRGPRGRVRSKLELRFATLLSGTRLPRPELNALLDIDGSKVEADCLWRKQRLIVELDGGEAHGTRVAFESDRERDRRLQAAGWRVVRVTWRQLDDPAALLQDLSTLLVAETASDIG